MSEPRDAAAATGLEVAIIGLACRFPGARDREELWRNLRDGVESIRRFSDQELLDAGVSRETLAMPGYVKAAPVLDGIELFDAPLFGFSPREAEILDPQQRLFLEAAWAALDDAGHDPERFDGLIGVYAGANMSGYLAAVESDPAIVAALNPLQIYIGNEKDYLPARVSFKLGLEGPSLAVQTACSTSLVAVHLACQALLAGECDMALAGGVSVRVPHYVGYRHVEGEILSPDGHCRPFDAQAQGTVFGNGLGIVVLRRLEEARRDGDFIHAVVKGSAVNNDGALKFGFTAPRVDGQAKVITAAHLAAGVEAETISYVEAHGTGTPLGDPIEIEALARAFRTSTAKRGFCAVGSVKSNLGHLDTAAGMAGLIKTVLALEHRQIPPTLHLERPNPQIDFAASPFYLATTLADWPSDGAPRRAGVSAFGMGGTNAHVVLEEAPPRPASAPSRRWELLPLSARTPEALDAASDALAAYLRGADAAPLAEVAHTLRLGRRQLPYRRVVVGGGRAEVAGRLAERDPRWVLSGGPAPAGRKVVFLFPGQGAQHLGMAGEVYRCEPVFHRRVDECAAILRPHLGLDLRSLLWPEARESVAAAERLAATAVTQPALFVVELALAELWMSWGVEPEAMLGHSIGEYVAACLAGVLPLAEALELVALRGRLMQEQPPGAMLSVPLGEAELVARLPPVLALAALNGPARSVVAGPPGAVEALRRELAAEGVDARPLHTSHAFHSPMMEAVAEPFRRQLRRLALAAPRIPYLSNLTGGWICAEQATDPESWVRHMLSPVRFGEALDELLADESRLLLEVGPGRTLASLARRHPRRGAGQPVVTSLPHSHDAGAEADEAHLLAAAGRLWLAGAALDWRRFAGDERRLRVPLPAYPFEHRRYWVERRGAPARGDSGGPRRAVGDWFYLPAWTRSPILPGAPDAPAPSPPEGAGGEPSWLLFEDSAGLGRELAERLRRRGERVATVTAGPSFAVLGDAAFRLDPGGREGYSALLDGLARAGGLPRRIVHLWNVSPPGDERAERSPELSARAFYSLLWLAQALGDADPLHRAEVVVVSTGLQQVTGQEALSPEKATLLGPCQVLPREAPSLSFRSVDLELTAGAAGVEAAAALLLAELEGGASDPVVAFRAPFRWVRGFTRRRLASGEGVAARVREGGVYLLTGGLGGIAGVLAEALAVRFRARLVLVGRSPLPAREAWDGWLAEHPEDDRVSRALRAVRRLEELGSEVLVAAADVADREAMRGVLDEVERRFGGLHGVLHAAGVPAGGVAQLKTAEAAAAVLRPKVEGTWVLAELLAGTELDFFVLFSSILGLKGTVGQVDYAAANAFLDAFAQQSSAAGRYTVAVDWDAWREVGMAAAGSPPAGGGIAPGEGLDALSRILAHGVGPQVVVSPFDLEERLAPPGEAAAGEAVAQSPERAAHPRRSLETPYVAPRGSTEEILAAIFQELLAIERVGVHDNFFELGGDSVLGLRVVARSRQAGVGIAQSQLFEHPTIADLAALVEQRDRVDRVDPVDPVDQMEPTGAAAPGGAGPDAAERSPQAADFALSGLGQEELAALLRDLDSEVGGGG